MIPAGDCESQVRVKMSRATLFVGTADLPQQDGVIGRPACGELEIYGVAPQADGGNEVRVWRPQASEGEAQHGPFCWTRRFGQGDERLHCG